MYNVYKYLFLFSFLILFVGFSLFFKWCFQQQHQDFINYQIEVHNNKVSFVKEQAKMMLRTGNWERLSSIYEEYLISVAEKLDSTENVYAVLLDKNLNTLSARHKRLEKNPSAPIAFPLIMKKITEENSSKDIITFNKKIYFNYFVWIPTIDNEYRYCLSSAICLDGLSYSNYIFTYGAIAMLAVYAFLAVGFLYFLRLFKNVEMRKNRPSLLLDAQTKRRKGD